MNVEISYTRKNENTLTCKVEGEPEVVKALVKALKADKSLLWVEVIDLTNRVYLNY